MCEKIDSGSKALFGFMILSSKILDLWKYTLERLLVVALSGVSMSLIKGGSFIRQVSSDGLN